MNVPRSLREGSSQHGADDALRWRLADSTVDPRTLSLRARTALGLSEFQHDPQWMAAAQSGSGGRTLALVAEGDGRLKGLLTGHRANQIFEYTIGSRTLLRKNVRQLTIYQGPVLADPSTPQALSSCLAELARQAGADALVYCSAVPADSVFYQMLDDLGESSGASFRVLKWGGEAAHAKIRWEGSVERYLKSLDGKRRGNVKRSWQKFQSVAQSRMRQFAEAHEVDEFLREADAIYANSDRRQELDLGPRPTAGREALIRLAAAEKSFLGLVLYVDERPIAYRYGYTYGTTLFAISTAFDRAWSEHKPGAVIFFEMLQDLERTKLPITLIDLLPHDSSFKRDRANLIVRTQNFYLFPRTLSWLGLYLPLALIEAAKPLAGGVLQSVRKTLRL